MKIHFARMEVAVKHMPRKGYVALAIAMMVSAAWSAEAARGQTPQGQNTPAPGQAPPAGQPGTLPPAAAATQGQIAPRTAPDNLQTNQATPQRPSEADVAAAASTASSLTGGGQTSSPI